MSDEFYGFDDSDFEEEGEVDGCLHGVPWCDECPDCQDEEDEADAL